MKTKDKLVTRLPVKRASSAPRKQTPTLARAKVTAVGPPSGVLISCELGEFGCDILQVSGGPNLLVLAPGDEVLAFLPPSHEQRGVVIGRIWGEQRPASPEELVLEATTHLVLRCGESSVTLHNDGKVLVKGKDVVSHAARLNRIRGGAVSIN